MTTEPTAAVAQVDEPGGPGEPSSAGADEVALERVWRPGWAVPVHLTLSALRRGAGDPSYRHDPVTGTVVVTPRGKKS